MENRKKTIIYVTRDRERGEGKPEGKDYSIISKNGSVNTYNLLLDPDVEKEINEKRAHIVVFKNSLEIEKLAKKNKWKLLNPEAALAERVENKITQGEWLQDLARLLPPFEIAPAKDILWKKKPVIVQWAHGHTGEGTFLIENKAQLEALKEKFPLRDARISDYILGPVFTSNIVVAKNNILFGNISYQITGIPPFTENPLSTIGNDWNLPRSLLSPEKMEEIKKIGNLIGLKLQSDGWKGLFGIDVICDEKSKKLYLLEVNARQAAGVTYESELQSAMREKGASGVTTFEAHLEALGGTEQSLPIIEINDGAQIIQRVTSKPATLNIEKLEKSGYHVIKYSNTKFGSELIRIQSTQGIMATHGIFNRQGKEIAEIISSS
ncbi:MAG: ATP-grasp domain-containing protein [Candidatus Taylorbacteria bacterium]